MRRRAADPASLDEADDYLDRQFLADWSQAFLALVDDNIARLRERDVDAEQNRRLGELLKRLEATL